MNDGMRNQSPADVLLRYVSVRRCGTGRQFREAVRYCFGQDTKHIPLARRLCALGHVEFDWDGSDLGWRVVPPSFYRVNSRLALCGVLSEEEIRVASDCGFTMYHEPEEFMSGSTINRGFFDDREGSAARWLRDRPRCYPVATDASYDLVQRLPPIQNLLMRRSPVDLPETMLLFNLETRRFDQEVERPEAGDGLLKTIGFGKPRYFYEGREIDLTVGLWLVMGSDVSMCATYHENCLDLAPFPQLPPLFERAFHLSGARRQTLDNGFFRYFPLERGIASMIVSKLAIRNAKGFAR